MQTQQEHIEDSLKLVKRHKYQALPSESIYNAEINTPRFGNILTHLIKENYIAHYCASQVKTEVDFSVQDRTAQTWVCCFIWAPKS